VSSVLPLLHPQSRKRIAESEGRSRCWMRNSRHRRPWTPLIVLLTFRFGQRKATDTHHNQLNWLWPKMFEKLSPSARNLNG
jgi:hypothetical protein